MEQRIKKRSNLLRDILFDLYSITGDSFSDDLKMGEPLIFGDSQIAGEVGNALLSKYGGNKIGIGSTGPTDWLPPSTDGTGEGKHFSKIKNFVESNPNKIIIGLGGNYATGMDELLKRLFQITPNSEIIVYGPPAPALAEDKSEVAKKYQKVFGREYDYDNLHSSRKRKSGIIEEAVNNSEFKNKKFVNTFALTEGYTCEGSCDAIHLVGEPVKRILGA